MTLLGKGPIPDPVPLAVNQPLNPADRYRWVQVEGRVSFLGIEGGSAVMELTEDGARTEVRVSDWQTSWPRRVQDWLARVRGICEAAYDANGVPFPGLIWVPASGSVSFVTSEKTITNSNLAVPSYRVSSASSPDLTLARYWTRAIVTLNERVFDKDYLVVQDDNSGYLVSQAERRLENQLPFGHEVELAGNLLSGKQTPSLLPMVVIDLGWHPLPEPLTQPVETPVPNNRDGRWTEARGVVRLVNPDGTLVLMQVNTPLSVWLGHTPTNLLSQYVDASVRVRGVLSLHMGPEPLLLVPSRNFVEVEEDGPAEPFMLASRPIIKTKTSGADLSRAHRVKISGVVTYRNHRSLFVQDPSSGLRVEMTSDASVLPGDSVEVVGFPVPPDSGHALTEALVRPTKPRPLPSPVPLVANDVVAEQRNGTLAWAKADLVGQNIKGADQILVLQADQRIFEAVLALDQGTLPPLANRSRLKVTGVCEVEPVAPLAGGKGDGEASSVGSLRVWLRSPEDVVLLSGPPWWTWKKAATLVGALLTILVAAVLWIHLLRRRLERQQAARLAFSRQVLQSQESERRRIAANLHDGLGQNLLVIKNQACLALQPATDATVLRHRLSEISGVAAQAIEEVRQITLGLRPYQLDRLGLTRAISALVNQVSENSPILFASNVDNIDGLFDKESEIHVYRIVQESINNVIKHSGATEVTVVIKHLGSEVSLSVRDNGRGFDANLLDASGSGLNGLRERTRILNGTLAVDSHPGAGTNLAFSFPASAPRHEA